MITSRSIYELLNKWKNLTLLRDYEICFERPIYDCALQLFQTDYNRWYDGLIDLDKVNLTPQLQVVLCYRISNEFYKQNSPNMDKDIIALVGRSLGQCELYYSAHIGCGLKINHGIGLVVGARCYIGDNCTLHQNVTLGDKDGGRPVIGNNVMIYPGAKVIGNIVVGDNCTIGANAVVLHSINNNSIVAGIPAHVVRSL